MGEAAALYKVALDAAPDRDEAPEAAMNGAFAYKQVGEYDKAIEMYELFISRYGSEKTLQKLKNGDPKAKPAGHRRSEEVRGASRIPEAGLRRSRERLRALLRLPEGCPDVRQDQQHRALQAQNQRREAAKQSLSLYASLGDTQRYAAVRAIASRISGLRPRRSPKPTSSSRSADLKKWDEFSPDKGANAGRPQARASVDEGVLRRQQEQSPRRPSTWCSAAYYVAKTKTAADAGDTNKWWQNTIDACEAYKKVAPQKDGKNAALGSPEAGMAAEGEYTSSIEQITKAFDYETGHHRYKGTPVKVIEAYRKDATEAKKWYDKLQIVVDKYVSPEWATAAIARQGTLYDSLRTGLYNVRPPELVMFDKKQEAHAQEGGGERQPRPPGEGRRDSRQGSAGMARRARQGAQRRRRDHGRSLRQCRRARAPLHRLQPDRHPRPSAVSRFSPT